MRKHVLFSKSDKCKKIKHLNQLSYTADNQLNAKPVVKQTIWAMNFRFHKKDPQNVNKERTIAFERKVIEKQ